MMAQAQKTAHRRSYSKMGSICIFSALIGMNLSLLYNTRKNSFLMQYTCKSYLTLFMGLDLTRIRAGYETGRSLVYLSRGPSLFIKRDQTKTVIESHRRSID